MKHSLLIKPTLSKQDYEVSVRVRCILSALFDNGVCSGMIKTMHLMNLKNMSLPYWHPQFKSSGSGVVSGKLWASA